MSGRLRFKCVVKKINNTGNKNWFHHEKHWKLQEFSDGEWIDVNDYFVFEDENGQQKEISVDEYKQLTNEK